METGTRSIVDTVGAEVPWQGFPSPCHFLCFLFQLLSGLVCNPLTFPSPLHSPRRARSVGDGDGKGNRMSTEPDPTTDGTGTGRD